MNRLRAWLVALAMLARRCIRRLTVDQRRLGLAAAIVLPLIAVGALASSLFQRQVIVDKLQRSEEECCRADDNLLLAMATFGERIDHLGLESKLLPKEELTFYKAIYDQDAGEPAERFAQAVARRRAGLLHLKLGETDQARLCLSLAIHILEAIAVAQPEPKFAPLYRRTLAEVYADDAELRAAVGDLVAAASRFDDSLALLAKLLKRWPDSQETVDAQAQVWHARAVMFARLQHYPEAEADFNRALAVRLRRDGVASESKVWLGSASCGLTATRLQLSQLYRDTNRSEKAIAMLQQAKATFVLWDRYKADMHCRQDYGDVLEKLAGAYADHRQFVKSSDAYVKALAVFGALETEYPEVPLFRDKHAWLASRMASLSMAAQRRR